MSFRQIFDRMSRIARSYSIDKRGGDDELRRAEELIEQERQREMREWNGGGDDAGNTRSGGASAAGDASANGAGGGYGGESDAERARYLEAIAVLSLSDGASWEEISGAYRRLVVLYHPDRTVRLSPEEQKRASQKTQELNIAYGYLRNRHGKK